MDATPGSPRWKRRPEGSNWGDFGPDDEIGRLNLITPAKVNPLDEERGLDEALHGEEAYPLGI